MTTIIRSGTVLAVAATLALSACSQAEKATFDQGTSPAQGTSTQATSGTAAPEGAADTTSADSAAAAGIDLNALPAPIASAVVPATVEGDPQASMLVSLYSLTRDGKTLTATFSFTVTSDSASVRPRWLYHYLGDSGWRPHLVDTINLTRHDVLGDIGGRAQTQHQGTKFLPGQTFYAYAAFAAPPSDVTTMTVSMVEGAPAATKVPIR